MSKRVVVFGALGQLGVELCAELARRGYEVRSFARAQIDIASAEQVEHALAELLSNPRLANAVDARLSK